MAEDTIASIHHLHQPRRPKTAAERARAYRERQKAQAASNLPATIPASGPETRGTLPSFSSPPQTVTFGPVRPVRHAAPALLSAAALALAVVGMTMNGWFARSLGATDTAGWLFLAVGVAADIVALVLPSVAARHWQARQRTTAAAGWLVWLMTFVFAVTAGIGFASVNIADVTMARSSRSTPAVVTAQSALADAMAARDRECRGGVGRWCRDREAAVSDRRQALDVAMASVAGDADPQTTAAVHIVAWASRGALQPTPNDFAMLRLVLIALLPQVGGILAMVGRRS